MIHFVEGAVVAQKDGTVTQHGSLNLPAGFIAGATGAGDAFAAGYLHGWHEEWEIERCLKLGMRRGFVPTPRLHSACGEWTIA